MASGRELWSYKYKDRLAKPHHPIEWSWPLDKYRMTRVAMSDDNGSSARWSSSQVGRKLLTHRIGRRGRVQRITVQKITHSREPLVKFAASGYLTDSA